MVNIHLNILHLEHRQDRLDKLLIQFKEQNINFYSIWEGTYDKINTKKAITIGHKRIVQFAKNNKWENCIIGEDDLQFTAPFAWQYFLNNIPESYDLFFGLVYQGPVENNRVLNGMSGTMTLYSIHERFYDEFLSIPDNVYIDRHLGQLAFAKEYYVTPLYCVTQTGGFSDSLKKNMWYDVYLEGKGIYKG